MDITEINAIEYGGAIAHVAAAQLFQILTASENMDGPAAVNWFGGQEGQRDGGAATVLLLAEYVTKRAAGGEQLWIWGEITGLIVEGVPESQQFGDVALARRLAFGMFASVCHRSFEQLTTLQEAELAARQLEQRDNPPIALEDSIFEPTGSLGELEKHAPEFFALQAKADEARIQLDDQVEQADREQDAGAQPDALPAMSIGAAAPATGEANEEAPADQGSEAGDQAGEDPERAAEVRDGNADLGASGRGDPAAAGSGDDAASTSGEVAEAGDQVAQPADAEAGGADGRAGSAEAAAAEVLKPDRRNRAK